MGSYKNPKTRAKAYRKSSIEKQKYANAHKEKELNKQKEKKQNYNKYNKKKIDKTTTNKDVKNKTKQTIKVIKHKKLQNNKPKFNPCAKTVLNFNKKKRKDHELYIMIPIKFKFMSRKLSDNDLDKILKFINSNSFIYKNLFGNNQFSFKYGIEHQAIIKTWMENKIKTNLRKCYNKSNKSKVFFLKYNKKWWFVIDIGKIINDTIDHKLKRGEVSYKYHIDKLYDINVSVAVLTDDCKLMKISCKDVINIHTEEDRLNFYWNNKESYGVICKEYHLLLKKANNIKKNIDLNTFYTEASLCMDFSEVVVKTSPIKTNKNSNLNG